LHRLRHLRLGLRSVILRHRSRLYRRLLILRLRHLILRQRLSILHRLRRQRIRTGHRSRLLIYRLNLLYRLILVLDRWLRLLLQLLWWLRLRLPVGWLRLRHRRGEVLAVVVHADSGVLSERLIDRD
jgi:hypothetical protein